MGMVSKVTLVLPYFDRGLSHAVSEKRNLLYGEQTVLTLEYDVRKICF